MLRAAQWAARSSWASELLKGLSSMPLPTVSVIIAAYTAERWDDLREAVASVRAQSASALETIVVVDNNPALLARSRKEFTDVLVIPNAGRRGASGARNTGVTASHGEVVAFLDDDAVAKPAWLETLLRHFSDPAVAGAGGWVTPLWRNSQPRWFPPEFNWTVGASYPGMPVSAVPVRNVWSNNMAIRRRAFDAAGGFREGFGKVGTQSAPEDTDLCMRAAATYPGIWMYEPGAVVGHRVPPQRATVRYFFRRCFDEGWGKSVLSSHNGLGGSLSAEREYTRLILPRGFIRGLREGLRGSFSGILRSLALAAGLFLTVTGFTVGRPAGLIARARSRRRRPGDSADLVSEPLGEGAFGAHSH